MAQEMFRERLLANFKPEKRQRERTPRMKRAAREGNNQKHLAAIRSCQCCVPDCYSFPVQAHHLKATGERGGAMRSPDRFAVPLCHDHHINGVELAGTKNEIQWFLDRGVKVLALAADLWSARGNPRRYPAIVIEHRFRSDEVLSP